MSFRALILQGLSGGGPGHAQWGSQRFAGLLWGVLFGFGQLREARLMCARSCCGFAHPQPGGGPDQAWK